MIKNILILVLGLALWHVDLAGQSCLYSLTGQVVDQASREPLEFATIMVLDEDLGEVTGTDGRFEINNLCSSQSYRLQVSHIGCESQMVEILLHSDTAIVIEMEHTSYQLEDVVVQGKSNDYSTEIGTNIEKEDIVQSSNENLSDLLSSIEGVSVLKSGSGVSKPIVHGLFGNRIGILNNGIPQAGQQWGNDHAPEIDAFSADELTVVKGSSALAYAGTSLGSVVKASMSKIPQKEGVHGQFNYIFQTNGLGHTGNIEIEEYKPQLAWRLKATIKHIGDRKSPDYYLTNTGQREKNLSLQLEKTMFDQWQSTLYYSLFSTETGILRGAHVGNLTDLESAIGRSEPYFTSDKFSYSIAPPRQEVVHHLLKWENKYFLKDDRWFEVNYGGQINSRKEFDVRRSGRSELPAMRMKLWSHYFEQLYHQNIWKNGELKLGLQEMILDNTNHPETGILPLIPDYRSYSGAGYALLEKSVDQWFFDFGSRWTVKKMDIQAISRTLPRKIEYFDHFFLQSAFSAGGRYNWKGGHESKVNIGFMKRPPEVNELYSFGLHQGVSGIEMGDRNLTMEESWKATIGHRWQESKKWSINVVGYTQWVRNFIYLQPLNEYDLTIRGAFPVFEYRQTNAHIYGLDVDASWYLSDQHLVSVKAAIVRGDDTQNDNSLVYIPADNIGATYRIELPDHPRWQSSYVELKGQYVFEQSRIDLEQDYLLPPPGYFLMGLELGSDLVIGEQHLNIHLDIQNLTNTKYRDYLNRQRYYADEVGINANLALKYSF